MRLCSELWGQLQQAPLSPQRRSVEAKSSYGALDSDLSFLRGEGGEGRSPGADLPLVCSAARILVGE